MKNQNILRTFVWLCLYAIYINFHSVYILKGLSYTMLATVLIWKEQEHQHAF